MTNRIAELKAATGVSDTETKLDPKEVVELSADPIGLLTVTLANGERLKVAEPRDVPDGASIGSALTRPELLRLLVPDVARFGGRLPPGVTFYRRRLAGGRIVFMEAGR